MMVEDRIRIRLAKDRDLPAHACDRVLELIRPWLQSADITPGSQPDSDNRLIIAVACFDPDGIGGSRADYIEYGLSDVLEDYSIRVHDRPALQEQVARSIDRLAVNPAREYRRLGLPDRMPSRA
ncbi:hypothetical protein [Bifidobacterium sp. SO1]|uniref:hypothetical protein n=1 Tax=Bifidobacterium sp. SO1 TaxID=2809029 RepID=UPI001BDBDD9E|nr:hypothetical protein [Bifidobacterium sp. SO1]MBT1161710.1 hypothetical protein [Bifidobacterium sp. SO1]